MPSTIEGMTHQTKRKKAPQNDSRQATTTKKKTKVVVKAKFVFVEPPHNHLKFHNKRRGELDIFDHSLIAFFSEFASVVTTPIHFYVVGKNGQEQSNSQLRFKLLSCSMLRLAACLTIRHR